MDREGHKGGVLILVKNNLVVTKEVRIETNEQAEIHGVKVKIGDREITLFNIYCPKTRP